MTLRRPAEGQLLVTRSGRPNQSKWRLIVDPRVNVGCSTTSFGVLGYQRSRVRCLPIRHRCIATIAHFANSAYLVDRRSG